MSMQLSDNDRKLLKRLAVPEPIGNFFDTLQTLMAFRNEWTLHRRKCDLSGDAILSAYPDTVPFPVYRNDLWWGDSWDPHSYALDPDFSKPFFEQFLAIRSRVPREGTSVFNSENSDYNSHIRESKNCYMNSLVYRCEDTHFSYWVVNNKDVVDCLLVNSSTAAYECIDCENIYNGVGLQDCQSCNDCYFSYQLRGCRYCIGCSNLVNKEYHVLNKPVAKAEFDKLRAELLNGSHAGFERGMEIFKNTYATAKHRALHNLSVENSIGDHLIGSKNCNWSFDGNNGEDVNYVVSFADSKNILCCYSAGWPACEDVYLSAVTRGSQDIAFCYYTFFSSHLRYCDSSMSCHDCFGCVGLRRARNCVFNKAYTRHEYEVLVERLTAHMQATGEWGKFFPIETSTFAYNNSAAQDYFPLSYDEVRRRGWSWHDPEDRPSPDSPLVPSSYNELPSNAPTIVYRCAETDRPFRLIEQEMRFYQMMALPPPQLHPRIRHRKRLARRNGFHIYKRKCDGSGVEIYTTFAPERPAQIYSDKVFLELLS